MSRAVLGVAVAAVAWAGSTAWAAEKAGGESPITILERKAKHSIFSFDYGPPTSPAMTLLGLTPDKTPPSTSLTKFVVSAPSLFSKEAGQSIAFDGAPAALFERRSESSFVNYASRGWAYRLGYRTRIGAAGLNGDDGGGDASKQIRSRIAFGLSASLLDQSDPLMTGPKGRPLLLGCLNNLTESVQAVLAPRQDFSDEELALAQKRRGYERAWDLINEETIPSGDTAADRAARYQKAREYLAPFLPAAVAPEAGAPTPAQVTPPPTLEERRAAVEARIAALRTAGAVSATDTADILAEILKLSEKPRRETAAPAIASGPRLTDREVYAKVKREIAYLVSGEGIAAEQARFNAAQNELDDQALAKVNLDKHIANCAIAASRQARFSPDLDVGAGTLWRGKPGKIDDLHDGGQVVWAAYKHPFGVRFPQPDADGVYDKNVDAQVPTSAWMVAGSVRYGRGEYLATGDTAFPEMRADTLDAWVGLERLSESFRFAARYGWVDVDARTAAAKPFEKNGERYLLSAQMRLGDRDSGFWLGASYGNGYGTVDTLKSTTALITLSFTPPAPAGIANAK